MLVNAESSIPYPPFVDIEGVINIRSVGGYTTSTGRVVKPNIIYRSGDVSSITERGREQFTQLGVHVVFDFRADNEIKDYDSATPAIEGVRIIRAPAGIPNAFDPVSIAMRLKKYETNELEAFLVTYQEILETAGETFRKVFTHLRDYPDQTCLVHCTAGKDRTGMFIALFMMVLGVLDTQVIQEYALTSAGLAPVFHLLTRKFQNIAVFRDNWKGMIAMGTSKPETMTAILQIIREKYGGVEGYFKTHLQMDEQDIEKIRSNYLL
ncbi:hypothetical protein BT96DRAFT_919426 [Gymnopus androsaceus JB14]|uniref:Tyrosine specific protein phosphatases domain-containing protein n=1 Tax=Gymnopus androsaceus JB14 TaxID=1447944 RepID=A0A6A4HRK8_9AGAR|nr:hypothetical protein BT96DRAFT_919426 [Gymnopus androsaceus JB14]